MANFLALFKLISIYFFSNFNFRLVHSLAGNSDPDADSPPKIIGPGLEPEKNSTIHWRVGDPHKTLRCEVMGRPMPRINWFKLEGGHTLVASQENRSAGWSQVVFLKVDFGLEGHYYCQAKNDEGVARRFYHVIVDDEVNTLTIVISIICVIAVTILVALLIYLRWKRRMEREAVKHITKEEAKEFREGHPQILTPDYIPSVQLLVQGQPFNTQYEIPRKRMFVYDHLVLGSGEFGIIVQGAIQDPKDGRMIHVAVKTVKNNVDLLYFKALLSEVKIMSFIGRHPNILNLIGACTMSIHKSELLVAVEFCPNGNLREFLRKHRESFMNQIQDGDIQLTQGSEVNVDEEAGPGEAPVANSEGEKTSTQTLIGWSYQISRGMEFLSSKNIIHADIAARNILLTKQLTAKISDFGLSRQLLDYSNYVKKQQSALPFKWLAIETLKDMNFSVKSDIWAYGVLLWEMFSLGETPYPGQIWSHDFLKSLMDGNRMPCPQFATQEIYEIMLNCWQESPSDRPDFFNLKQKFETILGRVSNMEYMDLVDSEYVYSSEILPGSDPAGSDKEVKYKESETGRASVN